MPFPTTDGCNREKSAREHCEPLTYAFELSLSIYTIPRRSIDNATSGAGSFSTLELITSALTTPVSAGEAIVLADELRSTGFTLDGSEGALQRPPVPVFRDRSFETLCRKSGTSRNDLLHPQLQELFDRIKAVYEKNVSEQELDHEASVARILGSNAPRAVAGDLIATLQRDYQASLASLETHTIAALHRVENLQGDASSRSPHMTPPPTERSPPPPPPPSLHSAGPSGGGPPSKAPPLSKDQVAFLDGWLTTNTLYPDANQKEMLAAAVDRDIRFLAKWLENYRARIAKGR